MTKAQVWAEALGLLNKNEASEEFIKDMAELLKPKSGGGNTRPANRVDADGRTLYYCRYTNAFYKSDDMVYQNPAKLEERKDKGYSKIGISIWNKGQKYIKTLKDDLFDMMVKEENPDTTLMSEMKSIIANFKGNSIDELDQFLTDEQRVLLNTKEVL